MISKHNRPVGARKLVLAAAAGSAVVALTFATGATAQAPSSNAPPERAASPNLGASTPGGASVGTMNAGNNPQANASDGQRAVDSARVPRGKTEQAIERGNTPQGHAPKTRKRREDQR